MNLKELKQTLRKTLLDRGIPDDDGTKMELLFEFAFNFSRNFIYMNPELEIDRDSKEMNKLRQATIRVLKGEPIQHVIGYTYFFGSKFVVSPDVLIPRLETEVLVDYAIKLIKSFGPKAKVLDLCSGSGAIGISVKKEIASSIVTLSDISEKAISISKINARNILGSENEIQFKTGNFLEPVLQSEQKFDFVLSNPPYIETDVIKTLSPTVKNYEPLLALDGGKNGIGPYIEIVKKLDQVLTTDGVVIFEIGETQGNIIKSLLIGKNYRDVKIIKDLDNKDRFVFGKAPLKEQNIKKSVKEEEPISIYSDLKKLVGVGPKTSKQLSELGVNNIGDLVSYYPLRFEDRSKILKIRDAIGIMVSESCDSVKGTFVLTVKSLEERGNPGKPVFVYNCYDSTGFINVVFFNNSYIKKVLFTGKTYCFYGEMKKGTGYFSNQLSISQPAFADYQDLKARNNFLTLRPIYRLKGTLRQKDISNAVEQALDLFMEDEISDRPDLPENILNQYNFLPYKEAIDKIHFPLSIREYELAKKRLEFDEIFEFSMKLSILKNERAKELEKGICFKEVSVSPVLNLLSYSLTAGQQQVIREILNDMAKESPMNRLVDGDVGSGKTIIAAISMYVAVKNGYQAVLMAPSTVLSYQHYEKLHSLFKELGLNVVLLTSELKAREKKLVLDSISEGTADIIIGTHSLIQESVEFSNLGLAVIDEQHRFGVNQRSKLSSKNKNVVPDMLSLSATPIPRSLALIIYGDMDISILSEKPAGRRDVETILEDTKERKKVYYSALEEVKRGGQIYIVHPSIEDCENELTFTEEELLNSSYIKDLVSLKTNYEKLSSSVFRDISTGFVHGKMKDDEKKSVMDDFISGKIKVLFSTTVIEVGVDVKNATMIIIENAERFGLSTLHQLRGRVGRGNKPSKCILISGKPPERLEILCKSSDGFTLAEKDLEERGPGDFFGTAQTGIPVFKLSNPLSNRKLLDECNKLSKEIIYSTSKDDLVYLSYIKDQIKRITL